MNILTSAFLISHNLIELQSWLIVLVWPSKQSIKEGPTCSTCMYLLLLKQLQIAESTEDFQKHAHILMGCRKGEIHIL